MKKFFPIVMLLFFISLPVSAQNVTASPSTSKAQGPLISSIKMEGFVLQNKNQFVELFKPYRNKHLSSADIDTILQQLQEIYEQDRIRCRLQQAIRRKSVSQ